MTSVLLARMIDDVGVGRAVEGWPNLSRVGHVCRLNGKPWCVGESRTLMKQKRALP